MLGSMVAVGVAVWRLTAGIREGVTLVQPGRQPGSINNSPQRISFRLLRKQSAYQPPKVTSGTGLKTSRKMIRMTTPMRRRRLSSGVISSNVSARDRPSIRSRNTHNHQPLHTNPSNPSTSHDHGQEAAQCFGPISVERICPPSSCPAGIRLRQVTSSPAQPAHTIGLIMTSMPPNGSGLSGEKVFHPVEEWG